MTELRFPDPPLADDLVLLRPWMEEDLPSKIAAFADPLVDCFSNSRATRITEGDIRASFGQDEQARLRGEEISFALAAVDEPSVVAGGASVYDINRDQGRAAVGFWLTSASRGRGIATHATRLLAKWAFSDLRVVRLELTCAPENEASQQVALRCGFVREGVLRSHMSFKGARRDTVLFGLLPTDLK